MFETSRDAGSTPATSTIFVSSQLATASVQMALILRYRMFLFCFLLRQPETGSVQFCRKFGINEMTLRDVTDLINEENSDLLIWMTLCRFDISSLGDLSREVYSFLANFNP